jgi:hypothetical protein
MRGRKAKTLETKVEIKNIGGRRAAWAREMK